MTLEPFRTEESRKSSNQESTGNDGSGSSTYLNESSSHSDTKSRIKQELESDGIAVKLEQTVKIGNKTILRPDVYAEVEDDSCDAIDCLQEGDVVAIEIGKIDASRVKLLNLAFDYVALVAKGDSLADRIKVANDSTEQNNHQINRKELKDMSSDSRSNRKRGPYIDAEAYQRLKDASDVYDMTVQDMLDELLFTTLDGDGRVKDPHSVLRNELKK